jgi:predicted SAM-dependent methyltransferase
MVERINCVVCNSNKLSNFLELKMPVFMGVLEHTQKEYLIEDMIFCECTKCGCVQIKNLIDNKILYQNNHNIDVVGEIWEEHYEKFVSFIDVEDKIVLEISDPSAKIASKIKNYDKWFIVEPNPNLDSSKNIIFIKEFFDDDFTIDNKIDIIIHSHLFEHIFDPNKFIKKCNNILKNDGKMFFSVPNLEIILKDGNSPNNVLHFEHTFYYDNIIIDFILNKNGFKVNKMEYYKNHSIFYEVEKCDVNEVSIDYQNIKKFFMDSYKKHINNISNINQKIIDKNTFLFASHISSQFYLFNGLNKDKIICLLDNSNSKENKYLYGTNLITKKPNIINNYDECVVICSHTGIYYNEIKSGILSIKNKITII